MPPGKNLSFSHAVNDRLREIARGLRKGYPSDHAFARALHIAQPTITNFLNGGTAGVQVAAAIARLANLSICFHGDEIVIGAPGETWAALPGWDEAVAKAREMFPRVSDDAWRWLGLLSGPPLPGLAPALLGMMAGVWDQADHDAQPARSTLRLKKEAR